MANPIQKLSKNGIINGKPYIRSGYWYVSYSGGYIFRYQWYRHGPFHNSSTDFCEPVYLSAEKGNPRYSTYPLLYRCYCYIRNNHRVPAEGLSACTERIPGSVHSTDRSKLSDSGACRSIRFQNGPLLPHSMVSVWVLVSPSLWAVWVWCVNSSAAAHCST